MSDAPKPVLEYADVMQLDIRIGLITTAERIPKKSKLLQLSVSFNSGDVRTVVTNIGSQYDPEYLVGKRMPFILNMAPAVIGGVESTAMILASSDSATGKVDLLSTEGTEGDIVI